MNREEIEYFLGKKICINTKNKFFFRGILKHIGKETIVLDDILKSLMTINISDIERISLFQSEKMKNVR